MKLYHYWRSSTSFRVRAALNLKGLDYALVPVDLLAREQYEAPYLAINPSAGVPTLVLDDGRCITQSMAIIGYLDEIWPEPELIPKEPFERARVMGAAQIVANDIHPVNNSGVVAQLKSRFGVTDEQAEDWMRHWMMKGFAALEELLPGPSPFAFGVTVSIADLCIAAQIYNARRWQLDMTAFPKLAEIESACLANAAIRSAHPDQQPEARS